MESGDGGHGAEPEGEQRRQADPTILSTEDAHKDRSQANCDGCKADSDRE